MLDPSLETLSLSLPLVSIVIAMSNDLPLTHLWPLCTPSIPAPCLHLSYPIGKSIGSEMKPESLSPKHCLLSPQHHPHSPAHTCFFPWLWKDLVLVFHELGVSLR